MIPTAGLASVCGAHRSPLVAGLDLLTPSERDADHIAHHITATLATCGVEHLTIATHWAQVGHLRHIAMSIETAVGDADSVWATLADTAAMGAVTGLLLADRYHGEPELLHTLTAAVTAHTTRTSGRVVVYPGWSGLTGTLTVSEVLACSAIDRIQVLAGSAPDSTAQLMTRDFVRPRWADGRLVLHVQPAAGGVLVPFETPTPTPCCADHA